MNNTIWEIYKTFVNIGSILIGGGYVILPILKKNIVENKKWITEDELVNFFAISQSLPGLIAANISIFIGYKLKGKSGAIAATMGIITAPFLCIIFLSSLISQINNIGLLKGIFWGIRIGVVILIISSIKEVWNKSITDKFSMILFLFMLFAILKFNITPTPIILSSIVIGIVYKCFTSKGKLK